VNAPAVSTECACLSCGEGARRNTPKDRPFEFGGSKRTSLVMTRRHPRVSPTRAALFSAIISRAQCLSFVITFERLQDLSMKAVQPALGIPVIIPVYDIAALIVAEA
jgi:hypothetical protein